MSPQTTFCSMEQIKVNIFSLIHSTLYYSKTISPLQIETFLDIEFVALCL